MKTLSVILLALILRRPRLRTAVLLVALGLLVIGGNRWVAVSLARPDLAMPS